MILLTLYKQGDKLKFPVNSFCTVYGLNTLFVILEYHILL